MYVTNGIAYAGEPAPAIKVAAFARSMITNCGFGSIRERQKYLTLSPSGSPAFSPLADKDVFRAVYYRLRRDGVERWSY